jgi:hypothetical protein
MNLDKIREILDSSLEDISKERAIFTEIAKDSNAIGIVMFMLDAERKENKELITDLNLYLSKAHVGLEEPKLNKDGFMQKEISAFYKTGRIGHCFKQLNTD